MSRRSKLDASAALERAALLGREFPLALLKASGVSEDDLAALFDAGTLADGKQPGQARFANAAEPKKLVATIPWSRARDHHLALGEAAKQQRLPAETVAAHFEAAHRFDLARAQWLKAGECACSAGDYRKALDHIDRCLTLWPWDEAPDDRVRVLREMARCAANARIPEAARKAWEELADHALDTGHHHLRAEALHQLAGISSDVAKTGALLAEAAEVAARELPPEEAWHHALAHVDHLANRVRIAAARQAFVLMEDAAEKSGSAALRSEMLGWKGLLAAMAGEAESATRWVEESLRVAIAHELPEQTAIAYKRRANIADYAGEYLLEKQSHDVAIRYCRDAGDGSEVVCMGCLSYACFRTGDWKDAVDTAREVLAVPELHPALKAIACGVLGLVTTFRGERSAASRHLADSLKYQRAEGMVGMELLSLWSLAYWHESNGDAGAATATYDEIRTLWRETDDLHDAIPGLLFAGAHYADHGKPAQLADCIDILNQIRRRNDLPECRAALLVLGAEQAKLEGDSSCYDAELKEAAALEAKAGLPLEQLWIECRRAAGDRREAIVIATRLGTRPMLSLLKEGHGNDLTPRQVEVLFFLAAGLTSKEIGDRMKLSTRTVEMHVGRLLERMNCRTRPEAVALAQSRGWLQLP
jgi:DNA-binding CsgD family transcriptional regulator/tetratricopeptide (TPR) repeat protein